MISNVNQLDAEYMTMAIRLGRQAQGFTGDNPYVGAVL